MLTKDALWELLATPDRWDPNEGDRELFFSDRLDIDVGHLDELDGVSIGDVLAELRERPKVSMSLYRWGATLRSPDVRDVNAQDHHPSWGASVTEDCSRDFDGTLHSASWSFG